MHHPSEQEQSLQSTGNEQLASTDVSEKATEEKEAKSSGEQLAASEKTIDLPPTGLSTEGSPAPEANSQNRAV